MGGLGRTINGSYAEHTRVRVANVTLIESDLPWSQLAAVPETYAIGWTCLFHNLKLSAGQTMVIRGATSSFGQAAVKMAVRPGLGVIATARSTERFPMLTQPGTARVEFESGPWRTRSKQPSRSTAFSISWGTAPSSIRWTCCVETERRAWPAGWVGWIISATSIHCCACRAASIGRFSVASVRQPGFPLSDVPLQDIAAQVAAGQLEAAPSRVFSFDEIHEAHRVMESSGAGGKMVVIVE